MTIRDQMNIKRDHILILLLLGVSMIAMGAMFQALWLFLAGAIVVLPTHLYALIVAFPCPRCGVGWGAIALWSGLYRASLSIDERIRYCPFCGVDIDSEDGSKPVKKDPDPEIAS